MAFILRLIALIFLISACTPAFSQVCDCVSTGNCPVPITDNGSYDGTLDVVATGANDLGTNPLTSVCFTITHTWIGDLSISLTSPSGLNYIIMGDVNNDFGGCGMQQDNIDVCIVPGSANPLTNNTEYVCNAGPCPAGNGTCCLTSNWNVPCGGVVDPINGALQAPNCDLDDINVPGDPASGTWTLTVVDVCNMDTGTLDNFSLTFQNGIETCISCSADAGSLDSLEILSCFGNPNLDLDLPPNYTGPPPGADYRYSYIISQSGVVLGIDSTSNLTTQPPGTYQIHGISYHLQDSANLAVLIGLDTATIISQLASATAPICAALSSNWVTVVIEPAPSLVTIDTMACDGDCIMVGNQMVCSSGLITLTSWLGCDSTIQVNLTPIPPDDIAVQLNVCEGGCVDLGGTQYCVPGPHVISLTNQMGCDSIITLTFIETPVNAVISPASPPALTCANNSVTLTGLPSTGNVYEWTGPNNFTAATAAITVTEPGAYNLTVFNNIIMPPCESSTSVTVGDGIVPPDLIVVGAAPQSCAGDDFDLASLNIQDQNSTNPSITYHSATPATPANELMFTLVSPVATTTYYILGANDSCSDEVAVEVTVNSPPTADFTASATICSTDEATINYNGNGTAGATYTWDFAGGTANPGTGAGPHQVSWPIGGTYTVSLIVEENGCASAAFTQMVTVDVPLAAPVISCDGSTSSIEFTWGDVAGATGYNVIEITSPVAGMPGVAPNSFVFNGLSPGDNVVIEVEAVGTGACGNSSAQLECFAENCSPGIVNVGAVADICLDAATTPFDLSATLSGVAGGGTLTWSGNGITNAATGNFDPSQAAIGTNTITLVYQEGNCIYTGSTDINVYQTPLADMTFQSSICQTDVATISFIGTTDPGSVFTWNFDGGTIISGSDSGPFQVSWNTSVIHTVTLNIQSSDGCTSETATENISVESPLSTPVISCDANTTSVTFSWDAIARATNYDVAFSSGHTGTATSDTSYMVTGLTPGEVVEFEVIANGTGLCGSSSIQSSCTAQNCPPVVMSIDPVGNICLNSSTAPINLTYSISGDTPNGTLTWTGTGVNSSGAFDPSTANQGANLITLTYEEGTCLFTANQTINVYGTPTASFTANAAVCAGEDLPINYTGTNEPGLIYNWNFDGGTIASGTGAGPYMVSWPTSGNHTIFLSVENADGCTSETFNMDVLVEEPLQTPVISCAATTTSVTFSWNSVPGVIDSTITASHTGTLNGNTYTIDNLSPGTSVNIEIDFMGSGGCPAVTAMNACASLDCPNIIISVDAVADFCLGSPSAVQLSENTTGSDGSGTGIWSGNGVSGNMFDPIAAGGGSHIIKYTFTEAACSYTDSITINVYQTPIADFSASTAICITDAATITFNGTAGANANFVWDFAGGVAIPGIGAGPHQVTWNTPGNKTITLDIEESGCTSSQFDQQVQVDEELVITDLICTPINTESVEASWSPVAGATTYEVVIISHSADVQTTTSTSYLVSVLNPGEEVTFQVTPIGNTICPGVSATTTCSAQECEAITVNILPVDPICLVDNVEAINLLADINGAGGVGTGVWSGLGVNDQLSIFDPSSAGEGIHVITYNYEILNCTFTDELEVKVGSPPIADAGDDSSLSCWESESEIRLGGSNTSVGPSIIYEWVSTSGDLPDNSNMATPNVTEPGTYTLVVTDVELGCSSSDEVFISSLLGTPEPSFSIHPTDCIGESATISIDNISGGLEPYLLSLNDEPFIETDTFPFLPEGDYSLAIIDAGGCESDTVFSIVPLGELDVDLTANIVGRNRIEEGESIQLQALSSIASGELDSIKWSHPELLSCDDCLNPMATPLEETTFTVILYRNGCEATDELIIHVEFQNPVYVPTAFSPNEDGVNDVFRLYPGPRVTRIKSFKVFDRWGEMVSNIEDFAPDDPKAFWDGTLDGKELTSAVFVWMAEIEIVDGTFVLMKGEVVLMR